MSCTYSYPSDNKVQNTVWFNYWPTSSEPEDLSENPQYSGRVHYPVNTEYNCSLRITGLTESDSATYWFRFLIDTDKNKYTGQPGVTLTVTDLQVSVDPDTVTEGQNVTLTCRTTCTLTGSPAFIWYKNNQSQSSTSQQLHITASRGDYYSCAVRGYENLTSPAVTPLKGQRGLKLVQQNVTWNDALSYCRKNHVELVSASTEDLQKSVAEVAKNASTTHVWLGLRFSILGFWFWVSGEGVCYQNWGPNQEGKHGHTGAVESHENHSWPRMGHQSIEMAQCQTHFCGSSAGYCCPPCTALTYTTKEICALKGSTVDMPCTYSYPSGYSVNKTVWFIPKLHKNGEPKDLSKNPQYRGRVQYLGNKDHDCRFRITGLTESDSATYRFRFLTDTEGGKYTGQPGVTLSVTGLQVTVNPDAVTEAQNVTLTCRTTCTLTGSPAFIWYKNNQSQSSTSQQLHITASRGDYYSCAVGGYENLTSPAGVCYQNWGPNQEDKHGHTGAVESHENHSWMGSAEFLRTSWSAVMALLLAATGIVGQKGWSVTYTTKEICALKGSTVDISCTYLYPSDLQVSVCPVIVTEGQRVTLTCRTTCALTGSPAFIWYKNNQRLFSTSQHLNITASSGDYYSCAVGGYENLTSPAYRGRVQYLGNKGHDCSLRITGLTESDSATYWFRFLIDTDKNKYTGHPGVTLTVTDLQVSVDPDTVTQGQNVTLTCRTTCALTGSPAFIWYKNNQSLSSTSQQLHITASRGDYYSCAVGGYENLTSPAVTPLKGQ
ncbi:hypothetical protein JZ751_008484, partial [Albula glossodonta]